MPLSSNNAGLLKFIRRPNIARSKLVNLIKKVRKKTGKTYYQRMQVARLQAISSSKPLTAKKYIKGVDFSFAA
jgi:hypothetical protein